MLRFSYAESVKEKAIRVVEERILDILVPPLTLKPRRRKKDDDNVVSVESEQDVLAKTREKFRKDLRQEKLEDKIITLKIQNRVFPMIEVFSPLGLEEMDLNFRELFGGMLPKSTKDRKVTVSEAREILMEEESEKLVDMDKVVAEAVAKVENSGIVFLDEIDKIVGSDSKTGPDISREGVQRDILPIVEGSTVATKYGMVRTDHILFVAAGAFHSSKPSDLIPELQGRFPIRVELKSLGKNDFKRILVEPQNALIKQYTLLLGTENIKLEFAEDAIEEIASMACQVNDQTENIGVRRLHTIMERLLSEVSFLGPEMANSTVDIDASYVKRQLADIIESRDLSRYIL